MKCAQNEKLIFDLLCGELAGEEKNRLLRHLSRCPSCRRRREELARVWRSLGRLEKISFSPDISRRVIRKISSFPAPESSYKNPRRIWFRKGLALAASLLIGAGLYYIFRSATHEDSSPALIADKSATTFQSEDTVRPDPKRIMRQYLGESRKLFISLKEGNYDSWSEILSEIIENDLQGKANFLLDAGSLENGARKLVGEIHDATWLILKTGRGREREEVSLPDRIDPALLVDKINKWRGWTD